MTNKLDIPFNISILELTAKKLEGIKPVTTLSDFAGATQNFDDDGLFSTVIFGKVGDEQRNKRFSYINIKIPVFHPVIHKALTELRQLYAGIMNGTEYVLWDAETKDFKKADALTGKTGFAYFMQYWEKIDFKKNTSDKREQNILLVEKYKNIATTDKIIVMPAGLRDMEITVDGRMENDEINTFYRKLLSISNSISEAAIKSNPELTNVARLGLQNTFNDLYNTLEAMIKGKKKLLLGKWASRRIYNGTRNVITALDTSTAYLGSPGEVTVNDTVIGLYQGLKSIMPIARFMIKNGFLSKVFVSDKMLARLTDKRTRKMVEVPLRSQYFDRWMTDEGIEKVITSFQEEDLRNIPLEIEGHYLGLVYKGPDNTFKIIQDIDEVPGTRSKLDVFPITFGELLYLSCYTKLGKYPGFMTRYPIASSASIYPSMMHMKTTIKSEQRRELDDNWEAMDDEHVAHEFPTTGQWLNSMVPHSMRIKNLGADYDGDTMSCTAVYSDESVQEIKDFLSKKKAYIGTDGKFIASTGVNTVELVLFNLTGEP